MEYRLKFDHRGEYRNELLHKIYRRHRPVGLQPAPDNLRDDILQRIHALQAAEHIVTHVWRFHHEMPESPLETTAHQPSGEGRSLPASSLRSD